MPSQFEQQDIVLSHDLRAAELTLRQLAANNWVSYRVDSSHSGATVPPAKAEVTRQTEADARGEVDANANHEVAVTNAPRTESAAASISAWFLLAVGICLGVFGGALMLWSTITGRADLWTLGMPYAIGANLLLMFGAYLQMDHLAQRQHVLGKSVEKLENELREMRQRS